MQIKNQRKGVVLFISLGLITVISFLIFESFKYINLGFRHVSNIERITQTATIIKDIESIVKVTADEIKSAEALDMILGVFPPISDKNNQFYVAIQLETLHSRININTILDKQDKEDPYAQRKIKEHFALFFERIFVEYQVYNYQLFLDLLADTLDTDQVERTVNSEIILKDLTFVNGIIPSKEIFNKILYIYEDYTQDTNIWKVPWDKLFYFSYITDETILDCNHMSVELATLLDLEFREMTEGELYQLRNPDGDNSNTIFDQSGSSAMMTQIACDLLEEYEDDNNETIVNFNIKKFEKKQTYKLKGDIFYETSAVRDAFTFIYDLKNKRIEDLEVKPVEHKD